MDPKPDEKKSWENNKKNGFSPKSKAVSINTDIFKKPQFPVIIMHRITVFFFLMCLLAILLYVLGTAQVFMDDTQYMLLKIAEIVGMLLSASSFVGIILDVLWYLSQKKIRYLGAIFLHVVSGFFGVAVVLTASFIIIVSGGILG